MMITSGVRQLPIPDAGRASPEVTDMSSPMLRAWNCKARPKRYEELMHSHGNPKAGFGAAGQLCKISEGNQDNSTGQSSCRRTSA
jgi:hypothetical protein